MKNWTRLFLVVVAMMGLAGCGLAQAPVGNSEIVNEKDAAYPKVVEMVVDDGVRVATYSGQVKEGTTVQSVLEQVAMEQGLSVETKHYDFGDLVEGIGGMKNTDKRAWIYFVNGEAGDVAAGEKKINAGDRVEWKYIEPIY